MKNKSIGQLLLWGGIVLFGTLLFPFLKEVTEISQKDGKRYSDIGESAASHLRAGRWEKALDDLLPLVDQQGEDPDIKYSIAQCYNELGVSAFKERRYEDALSDFEEGLFYIEDDPGLLLNLATTCLTIHDYDHAQEAYKHVIALDPNNVQALKELGELYYLINEPESAEIVWGQAVVLDTNDALLKKRLSTLRKQLSAMEALDVDENVHFTITYDVETMPQLAYTVLETMEDAYYEIGSRLHIYPKRQISVSLMTKEAFFDITGSPDWTSGLYEGQIKIPAAGADPEDLKEVLYHEFVHAVLFDQIGKKCPWWFNEGLAQYLSDTGGNRGDIRETDSESVSSQPVVGLSDYSDVLKMNNTNASRAYASALSAVRYLVEFYGEPNLQRIIESMSEGESFETAFWIATGYSFENFEADWKRYDTIDAMY